MKKINIKNWRLNKEVSLLFKIFREEKEEIRFIGGCVRDFLILKKDSDIDLATTMLPSEVLKNLKKNKINTVTSGISHGTVIAIINKKKFEITSLRKDIKTDGRRAVVEYTKDWIIDSERRDFTINAISCDLNGKLYDYHNGINDLKLGKIKFIGDTEKRIKEDYLRILRYFRFYAYYGKKDLNKKDLLITSRFSKFLKKLSKERISSEFKKILSCPTCSKTLGIMNNKNILNKIFYGNINLYLIKKLENTDWIKSFQNFYNKLVILLLDNKFFKKNIKLLKLSNSENKYLEKIFFYKKKFIFSNKKEDILKLVYVHGRSLSIDLVILYFLKKEINKNNKLNFIRTMNMIEKFKIPIFPLEGKDILKLGFKSGPQVGLILKNIENWWVNNQFKPSKKDCIKKIKQL